MVYLDSAATSHPKPDAVLSAVTDALTVHNANPGRSGHARALAAARIVLEGRERVASLLNVPDPFSIVYCFNCTDALNLAIKGVLRRGDHVISSMIEHNSILRVLVGLSDSGQIGLTLAHPSKDGVVEPSAIEKALTPKTRLVALTQASTSPERYSPLTRSARYAD